MRRKLDCIVVGAVEWELWLDLPVDKPAYLSAKLETRSPEIRKNVFILSSDRDSFLLFEYLPVLYDWTSTRLHKYDKKKR